jgi:glycosyltransferase involved in cell wall biosynthesis
VIAYPFGSVPEIVEEDVTGWIVRGEDEAVAATTRLQRFDRVGCRARFEERFTARRMARDYVRLYEGVA